MEPTNLKALTLDELRDFVGTLGEKAFRGSQIYEWIHKRGARSFAEMSNLSKALRETLEGVATIEGVTLENVLLSSDGTRKLLLRTTDGKRLETVLIPMPNGLTQCVSSQIGCHIGCPYCLTAKMPERRNLSMPEIVDQIYLGRRVLEEAGDEPVRNLVFMGMGEPLHNFANVVAALKTLMHQKGANYSSRRITVSTSGLVPKIKELGEAVPVNLAISLNAVTDPLRDRMVPINKKYNLERLIAALREFPLPPRRRITIEYVVCKDVNDSAEEAQIMTSLLSGLRVKINLIPFNPYPGAEFETPSDEAVTRFQRILTEKGYQANIRQHKGRDIGAACGQLDGKVDEPLALVRGSTVRAATVA
ncbi:MAG: 23S rRNA (adenine(2503)-C(2))-methyltransferase RlmN [Myxococcales bacterium]|nr:23S rRNA (adenine(2503)-C(2))-methyltransferase RlmN [Myxococcales bacterium]